MSEDHIVSSFDEDMKQLEVLFLDMGRLVQDQLKAATKALKKEDRTLAKKVVKGDKQLNKLEAELNLSLIHI